MNFPEELAATQAALAEASRHARMDEDMYRLFKERLTIEEFAELLEKVAAYEATCLRLKITLFEMEKKACYRCAGSGVYAGASRYFREGVKYCFSCKGSGQKKKWW